jgi:hypothetical protein
MKLFFLLSASKLNVFLKLSPILVSLLAFPLPASTEELCNAKIASADCQPAKIAKRIQAVDMTGVWDMKITTNKRVRSNGFIDRSNEGYESVIEIMQVGNTLSLKGIGTRGLTRGIASACQQSIGEGTIQGNQVTFTLINSDSCCPGEGVKVVGKIDAQGVFKYELKPIRIPKGQCTMYYGQGFAVKRRA